MSVCVTQAEKLNEPHQVLMVSFGPCEMPRPLSWMRTHCHTGLATDKAYRSFPCGAGSFRLRSRYSSIDACDVLRFQVWLSLWRFLSQIFLVLQRLIHILQFTINNSSQQEKAFTDDWNHAETFSFLFLFFAHFTVLAIVHPHTWKTWNVGTDPAWDPAQPGETWNAVINCLCV